MVGGSGFGFAQPSLATRRLTVLRQAQDERMGEADEEGPGRREGPARPDERCGGAALTG